MTITVCGSLKFIDKMRLIEKQLLNQGHQVFMPVKVKGVNYWAKDNSRRVKAKKRLNLIERHFDHIERSDAILVVNVSKGRRRHYIGANTFLEIGFAHYRKKKIFFLNPLPRQSYILDEMMTIDPIVINGDLTQIR